MVITLTLPNHIQQKKSPKLLYWWFQIFAPPPLSNATKRYSKSQNVFLQNVYIYKSYRISFIPVNIKNPILDSRIYTFCIGRKCTEIFSRYFSIISLEIKPSTFHFPISIIFISLVHVHPMANLSESSDMPVNRFSLSLKFWMFSGESTNIPMIACSLPFPWRNFAS